jgi:multisubunit Na+/H+ antiporter MnhB subunit
MRDRTARGECGFPGPAAWATVRAAMRFKSEIGFGVLTALGLAAWTLLAWRLGWHDRDFTHAQHGKKVAFALTVAGMALAVRTRRERQAGCINFAEGFQSAVVVCAVAAFLNGAFTAFYSRVLNPGWLARAWEWQKAGLLAAGAKESELNRPEAIATASQTLLFQLLMDPIGKVLVGLALAAAVAGLLRRKRPEADAESEPAKPASR